MELLLRFTRYRIRTLNIIGLVRPDFKRYRGRKLRALNLLGLGQLIKMSEPKQLKKSPGCRIQKGPSKFFRASRDANQVSFHQLSEYLAALNASNRLDFRT